MIIRSGIFHMFNGKQVSEFLERNTQDISDTPTIDFEGMFIDYYEKEIPAEEFPQGIDVRPGKIYPKQVIVYHLPFTGNEKLFHFTPREIQSWHPYVFIDSNNVCFEFVLFGNDPTGIQAEAKRTIESIKFFMTKLTQEVEAYNAQLRNRVEGLFKARKQMFLDNHKMFASLGVPLRKRGDLPETYAIPIPQNRKPLLVKPGVTEKGYRPEPTLDQAVYHVAPRFKDEGTMTAETFSKRGKTDILYRHHNSNVFVAECKFWRGQAQYLETITQLLSYLIWRNSKAAVIIFVKNKEISSVLGTVKQVTPQHPNCLGFVNAEDASWFNYRFHINDDPNREVKLAIMLYHIPDVYSGRVKQNRV